MNVTVANVILKNYDAGKYMNFVWHCFIFAVAFILVLFVLNLSLDELVEKREIL